MIAEIDEQAHEPRTHEYAQESWYFNWVDRRHDIFGLARLGYRYQSRTPEPLILTISPQGLELPYTPQNVSGEMTPGDQLDAARGLVAGDPGFAGDTGLREQRVEQAANDRASGSDEHGRSSPVVAAKIRVG